MYNTVLETAKANEPGTYRFDVFEVPDTGDLLVVDVFRDGANIISTADSGAYTDNIDQNGGGNYTYQVCEAGTSACSNESVVSF